MRKILIGIKTWEEAWRAIQNGMDALGFVLEPKSKGYVNPEQAREIIFRLPPLVSIVGVFQNTPRYAVQELVTFCRLDRLLFLGEESPQECKGYSQPIIKYVPSLTQCSDYEGINTFLINNLEKADFINTQDQSLYFIVPGNPANLQEGHAYGLYYFLNPDGIICEPPI